MIIDLSNWFIAIFFFHSLYLNTRIDESDTARNERLQKWDTFLETGEENDGGGENKKQKLDENDDDEEMKEVSEEQSTAINVSHDETS